MVETGNEPEFSVVITCHFEEASIDEFHARLSSTLEATGRRYEIIFVNDGSTDGTLAHLEAIFERDPHVSALVDLFKNTGAQVAVTAGCAEARGDRIIMLDSDLQLDPEDLPRLIAESDKGADLVSGYREERHDSMFRKFASWPHNQLMRRVSGASLRDFGCSFKIIDARLVRAFEPGPFQPMSPPHLYGAARTCAEVPVAHHPRPYGRSGWTLMKLLSYSMDNLVSLSQRPFQILSLACFLAGSLLVLRVLSNLFLPFNILPEVTQGLILSSIVFTLVIVVGVLAVVGEYVIRSYLRLQRRPAYVIRTTRRRRDGVEVDA